MTISAKTVATATLAILLLPTAALAHTGVGGTSGFMHGFSHPTSGMDHILAMVLVGIFASQLGGRALWIVPSTFVLVMAIGGGLGVAGVPVPLVEVGIALSVVVLGVAVAFGIGVPTAVAAGLVGLFAIFHGYAHGAEMPEDAGGVAYAAGFTIATAVLHVAGIGIGLLCGRIGDRRGVVAVRSAGGIAALIGVGLLTGTM